MVNSVALAVTIMVILVLAQKGHSAKLSHVYFEAKPTSGQRLRAHETVQNVRSCGECALMCAEYITENDPTSPCLAYTCNVHSYKCVFYTKDESQSRSHGVEMFWFKVHDVFISVSIEGKQFIIYFSPSKKSHYQARDHCREMGGSLLEFSSREEIEALKFFQRYRSRDWLHVGATDEGHEGHWMTVNDGAPIDFNLWPWKTNEPNNFGPKGENCAGLHSGTMLLYDMTCDINMRYLCEKGK